MQNPSEGVIKYQMEWVESPAPAEELLSELLAVRLVLFEIGLIGWDEHEQVGFGNLSIRKPGASSFLVSGTQTSGIRDAEPRHFTHVSAWDHARNWLRCEGPVAASSEALTHAMLYQLSSAVGAVIHVHSAAMWQRWMGRMPSTGDEVEYGSQAMADEVRRLFAEGNLPTQRILVMRGHRDGLIAFGVTPKEALDVLLAHHRAT